MTYPVATDRNVEEEIQRRVGNVLPDVPANLPSSNAMELNTIEIPDENLIGPVVRPAVPLYTPEVPAVVAEADRRSLAVGLVADAARIDIAVEGAVSGPLAVDTFHDVNLTVTRPPRAVADRVAHDPKSGPDALLVGGRCITEADLGLGPRQPPVLGREGVLGLDAARGPLAVHDDGHDLEGVAAAELEILPAALVDLPFVVDAQVSGDDVPVVRVG